MNIRPAITQDKDPPYKGLKTIFGFFLLCVGMFIGAALVMVMGG